MGLKSTETQWVPTAKQAKFLELPYSILEGFYAGAVGAGKSDVLLTYPIIHGFHQNPKFKGLFLRRTFPELKNEIIPRSYGFFRRLGAKYNKADKIWEFPNKNHSKSPMGAGALFFFGHCEDEDDVHNYDSMQPNYVAFDELTSFTRWIYLYIVLQRLRSDKIANLPMIARSASNPGNIGHAWVRERFISPNPDGHVIIRGPSGIKRIFIPATLVDNPYISDQYRASLEAIPDKAEREAKLYGNWDAYDGQVFDEFRDRKISEEPDNAIHVIEPFDIPSWWPKIIGMDWGYAPPAMTWIGYAAISPSGRVYIYREQWWQKTKIEEWCAQAKPYMDMDNPRVIKLCKSAGQDRGQEHTILQQVSSALNRDVELTSNQPGSRIAGKMLLHEYFRWKPKFVPSKDVGMPDHEYAMWLLRNRPSNEYNAYLNSFSLPKEESDLPKLQIFNTCPMLINAIKSCVYDKTHPQDVAEFPGDDPYDGVRYIVDAADRYVSEAEGEYQKIRQHQNLIEQLNTNNDMTAFYRNARALESKSSGGVLRGIKRYHNVH